MESRKGAAQSFVKGCCRVCGKGTDPKSRKALFTVTGFRDRIAERLSQLSGLTLKEGDNMSEFVCRGCASTLDKLTRMQLDCEKLKTGIVNTLMETSLRHTSALRWGAKEHAGEGSGGGVAARPNFPPFPSSMPSPSKIPVAKRILPTTPSTQKSTPKRLRKHQSPVVQSAQGTAVQQSVSRSLFGGNGNESQVRVPACLLYILTHCLPRNCMYYTNFEPINVSQELAKPLSSSSSSACGGKSDQQSPNKPAQRVHVKVRVKL